MDNSKLRAPGLKVRRNKDGKARLYWCARSDILKTGFEPHNVRLNYDIVNPSHHILIESACQRLQAEMLEWAGGHRRDVLAFDGTVKGLVKRYQLDPASPFQAVKYNTRRTYGELMDKIERAFGARALAALGNSDFARWYHEAKRPKLPEGSQRTTKAVNIMRMVRRLLSFGVAAELPECRRLHEIVSHMRFAGPARNRNQLTLEQVRAFLPAAFAAGRPSLALATAIQFETGMRQKDVIGEWEPINQEIVQGGIILNGHRWANGLTWADLGEDLVFHKATTKTGAIVSHDLKISPLVMDVLREMKKQAVHMLQTGLQLNGAKSRRSLEYRST
jgi:hypothetical protein